MFRTTIIAVAILLLGAGAVHAQRWEKLPLAAPYDAGAYLDIFFLPSNTQLGWACDRYNGRIIKTVDGGASWQGIASIRAGCHLEYIQFLDAQNGYCSGPGGAFKSTNGGTSWTELTLPIALNSGWGGWFRDVSNGWFTGGGCNRATFVRTTDGGASFTVFIDSSATRSKLADAYWDSGMPDSVVYAIGDGTLWRSMDSGQTFNAYRYTGTTLPWHEEMDRFGSSFLVSCASSSCPNGGYTGGGMRFSVDDGINWRHHETGEQMFGVNLIDATKAWASGWNGAVYYTSDAGLTWEYRGCGLEAADMDDIRFTSETNGWVVGEGVFRLAPAKRTITDTALAFSLICPDSTARDTVFVRNLNFYSSTWTTSIIGTDADLFRVSNTLPPSIASCSPVPVMVEYTARRAGAHTAVLRIDIRNPDTTLFVSLSGNRREKSAVPRDTLITFTVRVGTTDERQVVWRSLLPWNEQVTQIQRISGDSGISLVTPLPLTVIPEGVVMLARATPTDTGWIEAKFRVRLVPCTRDTIITVRVYGITPILESITALSVDMECKRFDTLRIPIKNTGNAPLNITDLSFIGAGAASFRVLYWTSGRRAFPETFAPGVSDTLLVQGTPITGDDNADLVIINDDYSTKRGKKSPWYVSLRLVSLRPTITATPKVIDLDTMCVGSVVTRSIEFNNLSTRMGTLKWMQVPANVTGLATSVWYITPAQRRSISFKYTPTKLGAFTDTLTLLLSPCDTLFTFVLKGVVNDITLAITPSAINDSTPSGSTITSRAVVRAVGPGSVTVSSILLTPSSQSVAITTTPILPATITSSDSIVVQLRFVAQGETTVQGTLQASATSPCTTSAAIPVRFRSMLTDLEVSKSNLSFSQRCSPTTQYDTIAIVWRGRSTLSMLAPAFDAAGPFSVVSPATDFLLPPNTSQNIIVAYTPQALGQSSAVLTITDDARAVTVTIPVTGNLLASNPVANKTLVDFGIVDVCQPPIDSFVTIHNRNANDRAVLTPFGSTAQSGMALIGAWPLSIDPNDSATVVVRCTPSQTTALSPLVQFTLRDETCGGIVAIGAQASNASGSLLIEPSSVDVGSMDTGLSVRRTIIIHNPSVQVRTITSLSLTANSQEWSLGASLTNVVLQPGDTVRVDVIYAPRQSGIHAVDLVLVERGLCEITTRVPLRGEATEPLTPPQYIVNLFIDNYVAGPGEAVVIPVHWQNDVSAALIDSALIRIAYLSLPFVIDTVVGGTLGIETKATWNDSEVQFSMRGDATQPLGLPGVVGTMHGRARSSIPDSTGFVFKSVVIWSKDRVDSAPVDGSLIVDACGPRFYITITSPTSFAVAPSPDGLVVRYNAKRNDAGFVAVYDLSGALISNTPFAIAAGIGDIPVALDLVSGAYIVRVASDSRGRLNVLHPVVR